MDKGIKTRNKQMKQMLRSLSNDADEGSKNIPKKGLCGLLKFIASITTRSSWILKDLFQFENEICSCSHKTSHLEVSRRSSAVDVKEMH